MSAVIKQDLVIALDYYDGEVEGFARCAGECSYFMRLSVDDDDINEYASISMECMLFDEIVDLLGGVGILGKVFVYSGYDDGLNQHLDELVSELRMQLQHAGLKLRGHSYLDAVKGRKSV
jgi:hypothetical protein